MRIQDIAKLAGVSPATVSRVFSHHPNIRSDVRKRVFEIAKAHGYHPRLSTKQRNVVIILPGDEIYPIRNCLEMVMMALTVVLPKRGFRIEVLPQDNLDRLDRFILRPLPSGGTERFHEMDALFFRSPGYGGSGCAA